MSQLHTNYVTRTNLLEESVSLSIKWDLKYLKNSFKFLNSIFSKLMLGNQSCKSGQLQSNHLSKWLQILFKDKVHRPNCLCSSKLTFTTPLFQGVRYFSVAWQIESKLFGLATFVFFWANLINAPELPTRARSASSPPSLNHCPFSVVFYSPHAIYLSPIPCLLHLT